MITKNLKSLAASTLVGLAVSMGGVAAQAQELKIGYVNSERVLREATPAKAALARMEAEFEFLRLRRSQGRQRKSQAHGRRLEEEIDHQNAVPIWNWKRWILSVDCLRNGEP